MAETQQTQDGAQPNPAPEPAQPENIHSRRYGENKSTQQWLAERKDQRAAARRAIETVKPQEPTPQADSPEPEPEPAPEPTQDTQEIPSADAQTEAEAEVQETEAPQEQAETEEQFPETLTQFAEAVGVDPEDFMQAVTHTVKVNGVEQEVSLKDLTRNWSSEGERSRHVQELAEERKVLEAKSQQQAQEWQNRIQQADNYLQMLQASIDLGPSDQQLAEMAQTDEIGYLKARAERDSKIQQLQTAYAQRQNLVQEAQYKEAENQAAFRKQQQDGLLDWQPDLREPAKISAFESRLRTGLQNNGLEPPEIDNFFATFDLRILKIADKALKYDELMAREKPIRQKLTKLPKIQKGGQKRSDAQLANDQVLTARNRLKSSGNKKDAVKLLQARRAQRNLQHGGRQ